MSLKKNILITGGAGFIGSHLSERLLNEGNKIICLDNLFTGSKDNISNLIDNPDFEFVNHDITKPYYRDGIDEIYNLACPASPIHYQINPIKTVKTCTIGVINMLGLAKKNKANKDKKNISEDENKKFEKEIQTITDNSIAEIEKVLEKKEKEIMSV